MTVFVPVPTKFETIPSFQTAPIVSGYNLAIISDTQCTLSAGVARACASDFMIEYPNFSPNLPADITLDLTVLGANGCYPNLPANAGMLHDTVFGLYVIANSSGTTDGSLSNTFPTAAVIATGNNFLPAGYDAYRRVGFVYIDSSTNYFIVWDQAGNGQERQYLLQDPLQAVSGAATSATEVDLTANDGIVPPNVKSLVNLNLSLAAFADGSFLRVQPNGLTAASATPTELLGNTAGKTLALNMQMICGVDATTGNAAIKYSVDNAGSTAVINVAGFTDSLGLNYF